MNPGERGDSEDQNKPERTNSQPIPESITDRLVRLSSAADAGLEAVATYVDSALPDVYATKSLAEEELLQHSDDDSYTFLDSAPHLHDDYQGSEAEALATKQARRLRERLKRVHSRLRRPLPPKRVLLRDKLAFVLGVMLCMLSAYWLGMAPATFYKLYTYETWVLFLTRFILYRKKKWHYFMFDFCYWANVLLLVHLWYFPNSAVLHKITFAYASGPLAFSVIAFRNSLVFHSIDKFTSLFVHWFPAVIAWNERWHHPAHRGQPFRAKPGDLPPNWDSAGFLDLVLYPMALYLLWAGLYYVKIFVVSAEKISGGGYETLFKYVIQKGGPVGGMLRKLPPSLQAMGYMGLHLAFSAATCLLCLAWWHSCWAHTAFLMLVLAASAWNGAGYYFDYFAVRYRKALGLSESHPPTPPQKAD